MVAVEEARVKLESTLPSGLGSRLGATTLRVCARYGDLGCIVDARSRTSVDTTTVVTNTLISRSIY